MNWESNLAAADPEVVEIAQHDWDECRAYFPREAVMWADTLRIAAFGGASGGEACGHGASFVLPVELLLAMPGPMALALTGAPLWRPEGPWPEWGRTEHPIDWPALIAGDPDHLMWNQAMLDANFGGTGTGVADAYRLLDEYGAQPCMDVCLGIGLDGRFTVEPLAMWSSPCARELSHWVDEILVDSGRPRERLREDEGPWFWMLEA